ncbi:thyroglobulin-like isoform X1 [Haliotis rubra]|uniref:thyroglobulin-like isoform X1 n=2 Tax=Haliotis rubra TaxID=36100 RepID=UPI001EE54502|nr:thyroglobulin-like isoform X1 [Haliotis rubra]
MLIKMTPYHDVVWLVLILSHLARSRPLLSVPSFNPWIVAMSRSPEVLGPCAVRHQQYLDAEQHLLGSSEPLCEIDGTYKPKQCRGAGCYCVDSDGIDLGYFNNYGAGTDNMDCTCARDKAAYLKTGLIGKLFFCDNKGSYSKKQCTGSVCFCADVNGKMPSNGQTVNIGEMDKLQC